MKKILYLLGLVLLASACDDDDCNCTLKPDPGDTDGKGNYVVRFNAGVESQNLLKSATPLRQKNEVFIYAYNDTVKELTGAPIASGLYQASAPGILAGMNGYNMYLPNNTYDFYAVSNNNATDPVKFTEGKSEPLKNGIDYLWAVSETKVASQPTSCILTLNHRATQVIINLTAGTGIKINKLVSATIAPSTEGATMNLQTGVITPATTLGTPANMGVANTNCQYTMLPLTYSGSIAVTFTVLINGETAARTYTSAITAPSGALSAGNSYLFKAIVNADEIDFAEVYVNAWNNVDETGNPIYPIQ
ncbi:MAG: fimbrillin family protein [Tannerellaceae bacterium]